MTELFDILLKCLSMILLATVTYVIVPTIKEWRKNNLTEKQQEQLTFWVETGVLWAKQWMQAYSGEEKKAAVVAFVSAKVEELGLPYSADDIDKSIEAIYSTVKDITDAVAGKAVAESAGESNVNN